MAANDEAAERNGGPNGADTERPASVVRILETAVGCFARMGYEGASMKEIAAAAGVSKSLLHYHFYSKEDLLINAVGQLSERTAREIQERARSAEGSPVERLLKLADDLYALLLSHPEKTAFLTEMYATAIHNERVRAQLEHYREAELHLIRQSLETALGAYEDRFSISIERLSNLVQSLIIGVAVQSSVIPGAEELRQRWDDIKEFIVASLMAPLLGETFGQK